MNTRLTDQIQGTDERPTPVTPDLVAPRTDLYEMWQASDLSAKERTCIARRIRHIERCFSIDGWQANLVLPPDEWPVFVRALLHAGPRVDEYDENQLAAWLNGVATSTDTSWGIGYVPQYISDEEASAAYIEHLIHLDELELDGDGYAEYLLCLEEWQNEMRYIRASVRP